MCHGFDLAAGVVDELTESLDRLHFSEPGRVGGAHVQNCVVGERRELPQRRLVVAASVVQGHVLGLTDVDANDRVGSSAAQAVGYGGGAIVGEAPSVEDRSVADEAEHSPSGIARLPASRDGPNLDKTKAEGAKTFK